MILIDSSVLIDHFRGVLTPQVTILRRLLLTEQLATGDLMLVEVLQGFDSDRDFNLARAGLAALEILEIGGEDIAVEAAHNFRELRKRGITVRKTIDTLIATRCIIDGHVLLHSDRDFDPFVQHLGLRSAMD